MENSRDFVRLDLSYEDGSGETTEPMQRWYADWLLAAFGTGWSPKKEARVVSARIVLPAWGQA